MLGDFMNNTIHRATAVSIVDWALWRWSMNHRAQLVIIVKPDESTDFINRFRVALAKARTLLRSNGIKDFAQFGISTTTGKWTAPSVDGSLVDYDVIYCRRFVEKHHIMTEVFSTIDFGYGRNRPK